MRIIIAIMLIVVLCISACSAPKQQSVEICTDESMLIDYYEENGIVYFICKIKLRNNTAENLMVKIKGISTEDVDGGLLENSSLTGYNLANQDDIFLISATSSAVFDIEFRGVYGGVLEKKDRLIPDVVEIEIVEGNLGEN